MLETLVDRRTGSYLISTLSGSRQILNLDRRTTCRVPRPDESGRSTLRDDNEEIDIVQIGVCEVGRAMILLVNLHIRGVEFTYRRTSPVLAIEHLDLGPPTGPADDRFHERERG
jgi:hypothetical protein